MVIRAEKGLRGWEGGECNHGGWRWRKKEKV